MKNLNALTITSNMFINIKYETEEDKNELPDKIPPYQVRVHIDTVQLKLEKYTKKEHNKIH